MYNKKTQQERLNGRDEVEVDINGHNNGHNSESCSSLLK